MDITYTQRQGVLFYHCPAFEGTGVVHGFSSRLGGISPPPWDSLNLGSTQGDDPARVETNFRRFCAAIGADAGALVKNHQVHGDLVRAVTAEDVLPSPSLPGQVDADGLITNVPGVCLTVFSADCVPVLLWDPGKRVAAAVHSGWRGTALGIAARAAERMQADYGCAPEDILAAIGPSISPCCFETHSDVPDGLRAGLGADAAPFIRPLPTEGKFQVDLKGANRLWLEQAGLRREHIAVSSACTACTGAHFWSHRRLGTNRGSMASMIQIL